MGSYAVDSFSDTFTSGAGPSITPGTIAEGTNGKRYMYVYNTGSTSITQYYPAYHTSTTVKGYVASAGLGAKWVAGVAVATLSTACYGWVMVKGLITCAAQSSIQTIGAGAIGGVAGVIPGAAYGDPIVGVVAVTCTTTGTVLLDVRID